MKRDFVQNLLVPSHPLRRDFARFSMSLMKQFISNMKDFVLYRL